MPELEERQAKIEGILEQIDKRLTSHEGEFRSEFTHVCNEISQNRNEMSQIRSEMSQIRNEMSQIRSDMSSFFKWTIGIMITMWITIILTILFKS